jgi:hypothetical protein
MGCHKDIWGSGGTAPPFFTSALDRGERSGSRLNRFKPRERAPGTYWIEGSLNPRAVSDAFDNFYKDDLKLKSRISILNQPTRTQDIQKSRPMFILL